ncbi:MAG: hypothetical protein IT535_10650 [Bauldia sp.]|nr:hypothetical protein [Bauldia sp.]
MLIVTDILLILHFLSLAAGFVSMFGNIAIAPMNSNPNAVGALRGVRSGFLRVGSYGVAGLWITGLLLLWLKYSFQAPWQFWVKMLAVIVLSGIVGYVNMLAAKARAGDASAGEQIGKIGPLAGIFALIAVIFAVLAFH